MMEMEFSDVNFDRYEYAYEHQYHGYDNSHPSSSSWQESFSSRISRILCPEPPPPPPPGGPCPSNRGTKGAPPPQGAPPPPGSKPPEGPPKEGSTSGSLFSCPPPPQPSSGCDTHKLPPKPAKLVNQGPLHYAPKSMALLSILGSAWILYEIFVKDRKKLRSIYHKIIALMSISDLLSSIWLFIGHWALPYLVIRGKPNNATGSIGSCTAQGFFFQLGMATPLYNVSLSAYSLLLIRYRQRDAVLQKSRIVTGLLLFSPLLFGLVTATIGLVFQLYLINPSTSTCNIWPLPPPPCFEDECKDRPEEQVSPRAKAWIFGLFTLAPLWSTLFLTVVSSILIIQGVRAQERAAHRWTFKGASSDRQRQAASMTTGDETAQQQQKSFRLFTIRSETKFTTPSSSQNMLSSATSSSCRGGRPTYPKARKVTMQSICFVAAFVLTWILYLIFNTILLARIPGFYSSYWLQLIGSILLPGQGFFNFLVFIRPRYVQYRERHPESGTPKMMFRVLQATFFGRSNSNNNINNNNNTDNKPNKPIDVSATSSTSVGTAPPHPSPDGGEVTTTATFLVRQEQTAREVAAAAAGAVSPSNDNNVNNITPASILVEEPDVEDEEVGKMAGDATNDEIAAAVSTKMSDVVATSDSSDDRNSSVGGGGEDIDEQPECQSHHQHAAAAAEDNHKVADDSRQQEEDGKNGDGTPLGTPDIAHSPPDLEEGVLPNNNVTDAEHENFLHKDLFEEEFEIMFYMDRSDSLN